MTRTFCDGCHDEINPGNTSCDPNQSLNVPIKTKCDGLDSSLRIIPKMNSGQTFCLPCIIDAVNRLDTRGKDK